MQDSTRILPLALRDVCFSAGGRAIIGVPDRWNLFLRPLMVEIMTRLGAYLYALTEGRDSARLEAFLELRRSARRRRRGSARSSGASSSRRAAPASTC